MTGMTHVEPHTLEIDRAILELMDSHAVGYGAQLPSKLDYTFEWLALRYFDGNELTRARIRDSVPSDLSLLLLGFSDRWATVAARTGAAGALETAGAAHLIEDASGDPRENILRFALVWHVAIALHAEPTTLFERLQSFATSRMASLLRDFASRPASLKSLSCMGVRVMHGAEGVTFEYR